uniref:non-specific serine/threonine protein kinase n=1 Tax=Anoplophora glabripennis TaxID=217634 RepID=V5GYG3_ANOGL
MHLCAESPHFDTKCMCITTYESLSGYVSDRILEDNLENDLRSLSLSKRKTSIVQNSTPVVTARELVLKKCGQEEPLPFEECYSKSVLQNCQKIGEGVYGEVFLFKNPNGGTSVMKVIPIEGDLIVNGERQKKFDEILSEITIALELSNLRNNNDNKTSGFSEVQKVCCVQGSYPEKLIYLWELYDETRGSENDSPDIFGEDQLYIVLQLANGGSDLEAFIFNNSLQAYTMFQQVACTLAVAEEELHFEHRDLHWGNVLLSTVDKNSKVTFRLDGKNYDIMTKGVEVAIIDFTLSRIECEGVVIFNDLSLDPDLFTAEGDYQFEVYKLMQKKNGNNWQRFEPYSNLLWLHYTLDKALTALRYKNTQTKVHKEYLGKLRQLKDEILNYNNVKEFVLEYF